MITIGWWNMGGEGNGAKREQYLDWWNKNWLETRLSGNPPIFFICSSSGFLFAIPLTDHTSYYSVFSPSVICDTKLFNIHFDDLFRWTPFSYLSAHKYHEYEYHWSAEGILFNVCRDAKNSDRGDLHRVIFFHIVLIFPHTVLIQGRKGLFTLI